MPRNHDRESAASPPGPVRRRKLFYLHGFDPRGPAHYHGLYRDQSAIQAALCGASITVHPRRNRDKRAAEWRIEADYDGAQVETAYVFLRWDDLVRDRWTRDEAALLGEIWRCLRVFRASGALALLRKGSLPTYAAAIFPAAVSTLFLAAALGMAAALGAAGWALARAAGAPGWLGILPPLLLLTQLRRAWRWIDAGLNVGWLNRSITYMVDSAAGRAASDERWEAFAAELVQAAADPALDEVLVVGHSQGSQHALRLAARALRLDPQLGLGPARVSVLTLGQPFAIYTALPDDQAFRRDLAEVAASPRLTWVDFTAPSDPASSGAIDPLHGVAAAEGAPWPHRRSPRFHLLMSKMGFRAIRGDALKFHFQYLMAGERLGEYDYFRLTAGPDLLGARPPEPA